MPRDLFGDVTRPSVSVGNRKWYTLPLSLVSHSAIVLILIALPILAPALMPSVFTKGIDSPYIALVPPPPPPPIRRATEPLQPVTNSNAAPLVTPSQITPEPLIEAGFENNTSVPGLIDGVVDRTLMAAPPPATPPQPPAPMRAGDKIRIPAKTRNVDPVYPPIAQAARVQGIVIIEATINETGAVTNARILRSVPLLDQSALDAVRQWQFTPSLLNGAPVPVIMTVTVNFTLRQ